MKNALFASAALAALTLAAPSFAQSVGSVGANYSHSEVEIGGFEGEGDIIAVDGNVAFEASPAWTVTLDGAVSYDDDASEEFGLTGTGALTYGLDNSRVGAFLGAADQGDDTLLGGGLVAETYMANTTLSGQVGYGTIDDLDVDVWGLNGEARYFVSDNFRLDGSLGWVQAESGGVDADGWLAGVGGEYQLTDSPISFTAGYRHSELNDLDVSEDAFTVGVRYSFGGDLRARDRAGANVGGLDRLFGGLF
jgi:hypothetical protein